MLAGSVTSHCATISLSTLLAEGRTRFLQRLALEGEGELGAASWQALEIAQAIERSLATPMIRPFLPAISCAAVVMGVVLSGAGACGTRSRWWTAFCLCILWS
jgi:hypothetical protein